MKHRKVKRILLTLVPVLLMFLFASCASELKFTKQRTGNIEIWTSGDIKLVYTYQGKNIVRGEFWEKGEPGEKEAKKKTNKIVELAPGIAKKFEKWLKGAKSIYDSDIKIDQVRDGYILKFVKKVKYNRAGLPIRVITRGYSEFPFIGFFNIKVDTSYKYRGRKLVQITEKNVNVDSILLNMGVANRTVIRRDSKGRPIKVTKYIGSFPPTVEETLYSYTGSSHDMRITTYRKAGIDFKRLIIVPEKTVVIWYHPGISWEGKRKYFFDITDSKNAVKAFSIYNNIERKYEIDLRGFMKKSYVEKAKLALEVKKLYDNERKGPKWRMGDLPDIPEPFLIYKDNRWWE